MRLEDKDWIKVHGAETVQDALNHVVGIILESHSFFDSALLENEEFKSRLQEVQIPDGIEESFKNRELARFRGNLDEYGRAVYEWYGQNFVELLNLL